ncbi:MAG: AEC family transporter [Pseudomonadota bacterium]
MGDHDAALSKSTARPSVGSIIQSNTRWNTFVALSLGGSLYGEAGLALVAIAAAAMIPTANVLSVTALSHYGDTGPDSPKKRPFRDLATNPLVIACVIGGALNVTGLTPTGVFDETLDILSRGAIGLGLLSAGAGVDLAALRRSGPPTVFWSLVRLLVLPALAGGAAILLGLEGMELAIVVIAASTPTATNAYVLSRQLGGDAPLTANLIAVQTVLAAFTMPVVFLLFT